MSVEITRQIIATHNVSSPVGVEVMEQLRGKGGKGEDVTITDEASKLADASEELGMEAAHHSDKKTLGEREVRQGRASNIEALSRIAEYYDKLPDMPREAQLKALLDKLSSFQELLQGGGGGGGGGVTKEDVLQALRQFDGDVTHQFAAIEIAREHFEAMGASDEFLAMLDEARAAFDETPEIARDVRAGFASAEAAARAAATLETDPAAVRDSYRAMLRENQHMGQLFDGLAKFDMLKNFKEVVDVFMTSAGRDLASTGPSTDPGFLNALLTELGKLKKLQTVHEASSDVIRTVRRLCLPKEWQLLDADVLTSKVLHYAAKAAVNVGDARGLVPDELCTGCQLALANALRDLHGLMPDEVMPSLAARQQQVATLLLLLGQLVTAEEEEFAAGQKPPAPPAPQTLPKQNGRGA